MSLPFLEDLAARRRFGVRPGLDSIRRLCGILSDPQRTFRAVHVAGTNGKGAVCAILDACLAADGLRTGRYTSPHLVKLNERFFLNGEPVTDEILEKYADIVRNAISDRGLSPFEDARAPADPTFFEALTAVAFLLYSDAKPDYAILETGLGGRLDATNVCSPALCVITRIGLDHCDWLGDTVEKIAFEKAGIIKPGVPVVLGANLSEVVDVVRRRAAEVGAPFFYAPEIADESQIPSGFSLPGRFNRENAVTAIAALKTLGRGSTGGMRSVVWPGRFQRVGRFIVDGAHNPPAARALASALEEQGSFPAMIAGFCGDKDVDEVLRILKPRVRRAVAVRTNNPRSLDPDALAGKMRAAGIDAVVCGSLHEAVGLAGSFAGCEVLVCGSLFLAGEALVELGAYPWSAPRFDPSEQLRPDSQPAN